MSGGDPAAGAVVAFRLVPWDVAPGVRSADAGDVPLPPQHGGVAPFTLTGFLSRSGGDLAMRYELRGPMAQLAVPAAAERPERRDEIWRGTCLEFFLAPRGEDSYWEFNLSPAGHWNCYRFRAYRSGMVEEPGYTSLPFRVRRGVAGLSLDLHCALPEVLEPDQPLDLAICAVIALRGGVPTYWALLHPGEEPDFHRREGFRLLI